jgi:hypothetical protein
MRFVLTTASCAPLIPTDNLRAGKSGGKGGGKGRL